MKTITPTGELIYADGKAMVHEQRDKLLITNMTDIEPVMAHVAALRQGCGNGFSRGRTMRYLGSVPLSTLLAHPELADDNELRKYLRQRPRLRAVPAHSF